MVPTIPINVVITPPSIVLLENKKKITLQNAPVEVKASTKKEPIVEAEYTEILVEKSE